MPFRRGATLPVATSLGHAENCDIGPTAGNGFYKRWPDDLALLADIGVTDLRVTFDWARLQPKPGEVAGDWVERYENMFDAADAIGITMWATLYEAGVPKWFANEGGLGDDEALGQWWPRWVERIADRFGDRVNGWIPFAVVPPELPAQVWSDTWDILKGGEAPVVGSFRDDDIVRVSRRFTETNHLGVALTTDVDRLAMPNDDELRVIGERWAEALGAAIDIADGKTLIVTEFSPHHDHADVGGLLVEQFVDVVDAVDQIDAVFLDPAIAGPESPIGLFDVSRAQQPAADAYFHTDES